MMKNQEQKKEVEEDTNFYKKNREKKFSEEEALIRPFILIGAFAAFIVGVLLLFIGVHENPDLLKWGGSAIIFSFILNLQSIYLSFTDKPSFTRSRTLNLKLLLFLLEIIAFNYLLVMVL